MRNLLVGLVLVIAGVFIAMTYQWASVHFVPSSGPRAENHSARVRFPDYEHLRTNALKRFAEYLPAEQHRLRKSLAAAFAPLDQWLTSVAGGNAEVVCVGEHHDDATRSFLARRFFSRLPLDVLMLEMRESDLQIVSRLLDAGSRRLSLLDADISGIIRGVKRANPDARIYAIEETRQQLLERLDRRTGSREDSILSNFRQRFEPGKRNVVLYGALHCADNPQWLINKIRSGRGDRPESLSINVVNAHGSGGIEAFVNFSEDIGLPAPPFAIPRTGLIDDGIYSLFPPLAQLFQRYDAAVVFDPRGLKPVDPGWSEERPTPG